VVVGAVIVAAAAVGLALQAFHGNQVVTAQRSAATARVALEENAYYDCLDTQTRSLVSPEQPVTIGAANLGDFVTLIQAVGSWVTVATSHLEAVPQLSLRTGVTGPGTCRGTVVVSSSTRPGHPPTVRVGSGASVAGEGPPPAAPL
jgi:hypothetical protein